MSHKSSTGARPQESLTGEIAYSSSGSSTHRRSHRSNRSENTSISRISKETEQALIQAATKKAELQCRAAALKQRQALEREEYNLQSKANDLQQKKEMLAMETEIEVEQAKIATLGVWGDRSRSSPSLPDQLKEKDEKLVSHWLESQNDAANPWNSSANIEKAKKRFEQSPKMNVQSLPKLTLMPSRPVIENSEKQGTDTAILSMKPPEKEYLEPPGEYADIPVYKVPANDGVTVGQQQQEINVKYNDPYKSTCNMPSPPKGASYMTEDVYRHEESTMTAILAKLVDQQKQNNLPLPELETFDGQNVLEFSAFMRNFQYVVEANTGDPIRRMELLLKYTADEPHELIKQCIGIEPPEAGYLRALYLLQREYGQPALLAASYKLKAESWPHVQNGDKAALRKFSIFLTNICSAKESNQDLSSTDSFEFLKSLASKLPTALQQQWIRQVGRCREQQKSPTIADFEMFVGQISRDENDPRIAGLGYQGRNRSNNTAKGGQHSPANRTNRNTTRVFATTVDQSTKTQKVNKAATAPCLYCGEGSKHQLLECRKFGALGSQEKSEVCKSKGLCFGCLNRGHLKRNCDNPEWAKCSKCSRKHATILHDPNWTPKPKEQTHHNNNASNTSQVTTGCVSIETCARTKTSESGPLMTIIPVLVKPKTSDSCIATYAFMDSGCGAVFCAKELQQAMHTHTRPTKLLVKTMNSEQQLDTQIIQEELEVGNIDGSAFIDLPTVYVKDGLPVTVKDIPQQEDVDKWSHLSNIRLPKLSHNSIIPRVTLMIGMNVPAATTPMQIISGKLGQPYAIESPLGWLLYGLPNKPKGGKVTVNFCQIEGSVIQNGHEQLEQQFHNYVNMEFNERLDDDTIAPSIEDNRFLEIMKKTTTKVDGHYKTKLPFRNPCETMPNNRLQAVMYANSLKRRLLKNPPLQNSYCTFMAKLEEKGYAEKIPKTDSEGQPGRVWYIPHHSVIHPKKPDKVRVVFNCPATYEGKSLNQQLLQGPDLTNKLIGVLLRWRQEDIAVMADIEEMFYQVRVKGEDCDMLRYVWWEDGDLNNNLVDYRMLVHIFGAVSSPSCANYILRKAAQDAVSKHGREVSDAVQSDFYVDDFLKSFDTEEAAMTMTHDIKNALSEGGFRLCKWISNSKRVLETFPIEERAKGVKSLDLNKDSLPTERALGLQWNVQEDHLGFNMSEINQRATRRNMLSVVSSVYDPLGFTAPFILSAKIILQDLCREKVTWDEEIPERYRLRWERWLEESKMLKDLKVDRCYKPYGIGNITKVEIHHFTDASEQGYGAVSYIRYVNSSDKVHCALLMSKSRVTPVKPITIPRLELSAATIAVRINRVLQKELQVPVDEVHYWTDSQTVLRYIHNEKSRFQTFVANRVEVIRKGSQPSQWHYVESTQNPADDASRGMSMKDLLKTQRWLHGPEFLWSRQSTWPMWVTSEESDQSMKADPEVKSISVSSTGVQELPQETAPQELNQKEDAVSKIIHHFSDWMKLKRAVAWWLRLKQCLQKKVKDSKSGPHTESKTLTLPEIIKAEEAIIHHVQEKCFHKEISELQRMKTIESSKDAATSTQSDRTHGEYRQQKTKQMLSKNNVLANLDPEIQDGFLKVGGRLSNACIPQNAKHQVILPKDHHVSTLIIRDVHKKVKHQGRNHVLAELRQRYWIVKARAAVRVVLNKCVICRKHQARVGTQKMADLPHYRVKPDEPAFARTGVDYFGPFHVKQGRTTRKRYGIVFTCLNSRAVHIEVADTMETSSCIDALRRFVARRGHVREIHSDNGTNLVGAYNELRRSLQELNEAQIQDFCTNQDIEWHFNPPAASHHGGVWERQIRTIRKILTAMLNEQHVKTCKSDEQLRTLMCEVESTINSRPLTRMSDKPKDLDVITPQDLLLLRPTANLPPGNFDPKDVYSRRRWRQMQYLADLFWKRWVKEYLPDLQQRQRWLQPKRNIQICDVVLIVDDHAPRNSWPMGIVQETYKGKSGLVRSAKIKTKTTMLTRPISKLCLLLENDA